MHYTYFSLQWSLEIAVQSQLLADSRNVKLKCACTFGGYGKVTILFPTEGGGHPARPFYSIVISCQLRDIHELFKLDS